MGNMNALAPRMRSIKQSPTAAVSARARELKQQGQSIINLGEGELDFDTPDHVSEAGIAAIKDGETRYTPVAGTDELKKAIVDKFSRENGLQYEPQQVIANAGAKQIIFNALLATVGEGDEVIVPVPSWVSYPDIVTLCGGTPVLVSCGEEVDFKLTAGALEAAITPRTKWLILNNPNNPTGSVYSADDMRALGDVLIANPGVFILSDDIYEHIVYETPFATIAHVEPALLDRTLTVNGVSKVFSMTGWRLGYAGGPKWLIDAIEVLTSQSTTNAASITQSAAVAALNGPLDFFAPRLEALQKRRDTVLQMLPQTQGRLSSNTPKGAFYVYANCAGMIGAKTPAGTRIESDVDAATYLLESAGVALVPGAAFNYSPYLRIAFAIDDENLKVACERIVEACRRLMN